MDGGITAPDIPYVAFEVLHVYGVKADYCDKKTDVDFGYCRAEVVWAWRCGEVGFCAIEVREEVRHCGFVCGLRPDDVLAESSGCSMNRKAH